MTRVWRFALAIVVLAAGPARADLLIKEHITAQVGDRRVESERSTYIKGTRMRVEAVQGDQSATVLYDLPAGMIVELDAKKKRAQVYAIAARAAKLEKEYPRAKTSVSVTPTGATRAGAGSACDAYTFAIRVPVSSDGKMGLTATGTACLAGAGPGAGDYGAFAQAARELELVQGIPTDNAILLSIARAQTELYRAMTAIPGVPHFAETAYGVDGGGLLVKIMRKAASGSRTTTVTSIDVSPLDDALFAIPDGWKREKK